MTSAKIENQNQILVRLDSMSKNVPSIWLELAIKSRAAIIMGGL